MNGLAIALALALASPGPLMAQAGPRSDVWPAARQTSPPAPAISHDPVEEGVAYSLWPTAASLVLPGSGQLLNGQRRWGIYAALEAAGWLVHLERSRRGRDLRDRYRDLARSVAFVGAPGTGEAGDWAYYERLEQWAASGAWDADPGRPGVQPEDDPATFNGSVWALARDLFLQPEEGEGSPGYARALEYYQGRAYPPGLLWDWTGKEESLNRYVDLIDRSDEALRTATIVLGAVVANHLVSAADAFVSARLGSEIVPATALVERGSGVGVEWRVEIRP